MVAHTHDPRQATPGCWHCANTGLHFPDGRRCWRHMTRDHAGLVEHTEAEREAAGLPEWPQGPSFDVSRRLELLDWMAGADLTYRQGHVCGWWLTTGRCPGRACAEAPQAPWADHLTGWTRDGEPAVLVAQPYRSSIVDPLLEDLMATPALEAVTPLKFELDRAGRWYGGDTVWFAIWREDAA